MSFYISSLFYISHHIQLLWANLCVLLPVVYITIRNVFLLLFSMTPNRTKRKKIGQTTIRFMNKWYYSIMSCRRSLECGVKCKDVKIFTDKIIKTLKTTLLVSPKCSYASSFTLYLTLVVNMCIFVIWAEKLHYVIQSVQCLTASFFSQFFFSFDFVEIN